MKRGDRGERVKELQHFLNLHLDTKLTVDGIFGKQTEDAVKAYQAAHNLAVTGQMSLNDKKENTLIIERFLPSNEYINSSSKKRGVCLHHTASNGNAYNVPKVWNGDSRGRVATHFVIGADGTILQVIPLENWAYHIAMKRMGFSTSHNNMINSEYIGIEICNWGYLEEKNGRYYNYLGRETPPSEVVRLEKPFRYFQYWHRYTDAQVAAVRYLLKYLAEMFDFKYETAQEIPHNHSWLDLSFHAMRGDRVLTTHTNFEVGKWDCSPQPNFFKMLT